MNARPYITAASAARELGYTISNYITDRCRRGKIPGAYQDGGIWLVPAAWVQAKKEQDAEHGIERGIKPGGHVTTGTGLKRKRPAYAYTPTGKPPGRPKKQKADVARKTLEDMTLEELLASPQASAEAVPYAFRPLTKEEEEADARAWASLAQGGAHAITGAPITEDMLMQEAIERMEVETGRRLTDAEIREFKRVKGAEPSPRHSGRRVR